MQTRSSDENSVCPSVRPSLCPPVKRVDCDKTEERSVTRFLYHTKDHLAYSLLRRRMVDGGDPFYLKFWVNRPLLERNRRFSTDIRSSRLSDKILVNTRSDLDVTASETPSINTNRKSTARFSMSPR